MSHPNMAAMYHQPASSPVHVRSPCCCHRHTGLSSLTSMQDGKSSQDMRSVPFTFSHYVAKASNSLRVLYTVPRTTYAKDLGSPVIRSCALVSPRALNLQRTCAAIVAACVCVNDRQVGSSDRLQTGTGSRPGLHRCHLIDISAPLVQCSTHAERTLDCSACARADLRCVVEAIRQLARLHLTDCVLHQIESTFPRVPRRAILSRKHWGLNGTHMQRCTRLQRKAR